MTADDFSNEGFEYLLPGNVPNKMIAFLLVNYIDLRTSCTEFFYDALSYSVLLRRSPRQPYY